MIMLAVSKDSYLEKTLDQDFLAAIKRNSRTVRLNVARSGKPFEDTLTCKNDPLCDRVTINAEKRILIITCGTNPPDKVSAPDCSAAPALYQEKCLETLPQARAFIDALWNHSKAFHEREDQ